MDMMELEMIKTAHEIIQNLNVTENEEVSVITDSELLSVGRCIAQASNVKGATTTLIIAPLIERHSNDPPNVVSKAILASDVAFTCTSKAISHTNTRREAADQGIRLGLLRGVTENMMIDGAMTADFERLRDTTDSLSNLMTKSSKVVVTSENGTDIEFSIDGCEAFSLSGFPTPNEERRAAAFPPGEAPVHPAEGSAEGKITIDVSMDNIGKLNEPINLRVEKGRVEEVSGGDQADELHSIIEQSDKNARNLAEFAIGTNPKAKLIGNLAEDKKREGTVHFAIGDNKTLGGTVDSNIHLDGVIRNPTVKLDGTTIVRAGKLKTETFL